MSAVRFAVAATLLLSANAFASEIIVDTGLGGGSTTSIYNKGDLDFQTIAARFDLSDRYTLTDIEGSISAYSTSTFSISIFSNSNNLPGDALMSATLTTPRTNSVYTDAWVGLHNQSLTLDAGSYWVVFGGVAGQAASMGMGMYGVSQPLSEYRIMNALNGLPPQWLSQGGNIAYGVRIQGVAAPVPDVSTATMSLLGCVGIAQLMARKRSKSKVSMVSSTLL